MMDLICKNLGALIYEDPMCHLSNKSIFTPRQQKNRFVNTVSVSEM